MHKNIRIGIAGLGRLGKRHAESLAFRTRHCELVAACSPVADERTYASE
jgi:myo-inositol 2-dehydrogenase/D-chiro-inositol 1-dehydrogenase